MFHSVEEIREANRRSDYHFFDTDTMRGFGSRVVDEVYAGRIFITSEKDRSHTYSDGTRSSGAWNGQRRYTVRIARDDGSVGELSEFGELDTLAQARRFAQKMADATPAAMLAEAEAAISRAYELVHATTAEKGNDPSDTFEQNLYRLKWSVYDAKREIEKREDEEIAAR